MGAVTSTLERMVIDWTWSCHEWLYGSATGAGACNKPRPAVTRRRCRQNMPSSSSSGSSSGGDAGGVAVGSSSLSLRRRAQQQQLHQQQLQQLQQQELDKLVPKPPTTAAELPPPPPPTATMTTTCRGLPSFLPRAAGASATSASSASSDDDWAPPPPSRRLPRTDLAFTEASMEALAASGSCQPRRRATMSLMYSGSRRHPHHLHYNEDVLGQVPAPQAARQPKRPNVPYSTLQAMLFRCTAARNGCLSSKDCNKDKAYPVRRLGRSWSVHNATANRAATL